MAAVEVFSCPICICDDVTSNRRDNARLAIAQTHAPPIDQEPRERLREFVEAFHQHVVYGVAARERLRRGGPRTAKSSYHCSACDIEVCMTCAKSHILAKGRAVHTCIACEAEWSAYDIRDQCGRDWIDGPLVVRRERAVVEQELGIIQKTKAARYAGRAAFKCQAVGCGGYITRPILPCPNCNAATAVECTSFRSWRIDCSDDWCARMYPCSVHGHATHCDSCRVESCAACQRVVAREDVMTHECRDEDVEMVRIVATTTKACPGCLTRVEKNDGCEEMYCSLCATTFHWITGAIIAPSARAHNPEYERRMKELGLSTRTRQEINDIASIDIASIPLVMCSAYLLATIGLIDSLAGRMLDAYDVSAYGDNSVYRDAYIAMTNFETSRRRDITATREMTAQFDAIDTHMTEILGYSIARRERFGRRTRDVREALATFVFDAARAIKTLIGSARDIVDKYNSPAAADRRLSSIERFRLMAYVGLLPIDQLTDDDKDAVSTLHRVFREETIPTLMLVTNRSIARANDLYKEFPPIEILLRDDAFARPILRSSTDTVANMTNMDHSNDTHYRRLRDVKQEEGDWYRRVYIGEYPQPAMPSSIGIVLLAYNMMAPSAPRLPTARSDLPLE
jgi:hypothetical protein